MNFWSLVQKIWGFKQQTNILPEQDLAPLLIQMMTFLLSDGGSSGFFFGAAEAVRGGGCADKAWNAEVSCLTACWEAWSWRWDSLSCSACWLAKSFASFICFCCVSASCCWLGEQCWLHVRCCSCGCALKDDAVDELLEGVKNQLGGCRRVDWSWLLSLKVVAAVVCLWWLFMLL